jgi:hypothetical protein
MAFWLSTSRTEQAPSRVLCAAISWPVEVSVYLSWPGWPTEARR